MLALNNSLNVDDTGNTAGTLNGRYKVYIDICVKQYCGSILHSGLQRKKRGAGMFPGHNTNGKSSRRKHFWQKLVSKLDMV